MKQNLTFKRLFLLSWHHKSLLIGGMIATLLSVLTNMIFPIITGTIINTLTYDDYQDAITGPMVISCYLSPWNCYDNKMHLLDTGVCTVIIIGFFSAFFAFGRWFLLELAGERLVAVLRNQLFHSILFAEPGMFDTVKTGALINRLSTDTMELKSICTVQLAQCIHNVFNVILSVCYVFYLSWSLTLVLLTVVPFVAVSSRLFGIYYRTQSRITQDLLAKSNDIAAESICNIRTVKAFSIESHEEYLFAFAIFKTYNQGLKMVKMKSLFSATTNILTNVALTLVVWFGAKQVIDGALSAGDLGTYVMMAMNIKTALSVSVGLYSQIMKALGAGERTFKLIDRESMIPPFGGRKAMPSTLTPYRDSLNFGKNKANKAIKDSKANEEKRKSNKERNSEIEMGLLNQNNPEFDVEYKYNENDPLPIRGDIELESVDFLYPSRPTVQVLDDVNLRIAPGQITALVGESGGGKSSIIQLLLRFYDPIRGQIKIDGQDLRDYDLNWLQQNIGFVSQEPVLFARSIRENITFGMKEEEEENMIMKKIEDAARRANAYDFITRFPDGFDTKVGERGGRLSGGQKQRVAIARAIINDPKILLLDEATSALDTESEYLVQKALDRIISDGNKTVIVIAHRLSTVKNADNIVVIDQGKVVEQGTHVQLLEDEGIYYNLVQRQLFASEAT